MNAQQFRIPTSPNPFPSYNVSPKQVESQLAQPAEQLNARYPGYAPRTSDGTLFTDYSPQCTKNTPVGQQYATRQWLQHNAEQFIQVSRDRQVKALGASFQNAATVPPPVAYVKCTTDTCEYYPGARTTTTGPIPTGIERTESAPPLFGTFEYAYRTPAPKPAHRTTTHYEGGRNTPRGTQ
jgi:hypothetical protein